MSYLPRSKVGEEEIPSRNTFKYIGSIWRLREEQKEIARTELIPGSIQTHHGVRCRMLGHEKERGTSSK